MIGGVTVDRMAGRPSPGSGPPARSPVPASTGPTGWPRTACSKGWSTARAVAEDIAEELDRDRALAAGGPADLGPAGAETATPTSTSATSANRSAP